MTEKQSCSECKHLEYDGMAGIWCGVHGNNKNYDCPKFEYNWGRLTKEKAINHLKRLYYENDQLKQSVNNLKETIIKITIAYQRKYDRTIVDLVDEVHDEDITDLIKKLSE